MNTLDHNNMAQVNAVLEALLSENHPNHAEARRMAEEFGERAHEARVEAGRRMMQEQIDAGADLDPWTR